MGIERLVKEYDIDVFHNVLGSTLSSFKSGGIVENLYYPKNKESLMALLDNIENYHILGRFTNALISDAGVQNVVSIKEIKGIDIRDNIFNVACGESLMHLSHVALENGLAGLERLSGIPGSVGGAICMNAGAYDAEIGDNVIEIEVLSGRNVKILQNKDIKFRYRGSAVLDKRLIVLSAKLQLLRADKNDILIEMSRVQNKRNASQPKEPSVGSTFLKYSGLSAGAYIDAIGLKGLKVGGAMVSEKHSGFIVNTGNATTADYLSLVEVIEEKVRCAYGINLKREFIYIGD